MASEEYFFLFGLLSLCITLIKFLLLNYLCTSEINFIFLWNIIHLVNCCICFRCFFSLGYGCIFIGEVELIILVLEISWVVVTEFWQALKWVQKVPFFSCSGTFIQSRNYELLGILDIFVYIIRPENFHVGNFGGQFLQWFFFLSVQVYYYYCCH